MARGTSPGSITDRALKLLLNSSEARSSREIATMMGVKTSSITNTLKRLEDEGAVSVTGSGRSRYWYITTAGRERYARGR